MSCLIRVCLLCAMYSPCCSGGSLARFALNSCTIFFWWSVRGGPVPVEGSRGWRLGGGARGCLGSMLEDVIGGRVGGCNCGSAPRTGPGGGGPPTRTTRTTCPVDKIWCCLACFQDRKCSLRCLDLAGKISGCVSCLLQLQVQHFCHDMKVRGWGPSGGITAGQC